MHNRSEDRSDTISLPGERTSRRKLLGDRELMLKKNKLATQDVSNSNERTQNAVEEELGNGVFDRFSLARKTLDRNSIRKPRAKEDPDTMSLNDLSFERKKSSSMSDWKSRLANKFKGNKEYEVIDKAEAGGVHIESYKKTSDEFGESIPTTPSTEPPRRRPLNIPNGSPGGGSIGAKDEHNRQQAGSKRLSVTSSDRNVPRSSGSGNGRKQINNHLNMRKTSYGGTSGDYDSQLDSSGKWTTTVPIISMDDVSEINEEDIDSGNIRPKHRPSPRGLKDLKKPVGEDAAERLSERLRNQGIGATTTGGRKAVSHGPNVFDRLAKGGGSVSSSRKSLMTNSSSDDYERKGGALTKIKDLTKNLRQKTSREEDPSQHIKSNGTSVVAPRNSMSLSGRVPMSNLNRLSSPSKSSISSSTRSLHKSQDHVNITTKTSASTLSPNSISSSRSTGRSTSTFGESRKAVPSRATISNNLHSSKENLSRSPSSSTSNSLTDMSRNGLMRTTISSPNITTITTTSVARSSPMRLASSSTSGGTTSVLAPPGSPMKGRRATPSSNLSFMKPTTASSTKKLSSNVNGSVISSGGGGININNVGTNSPIVTRKTIGSGGRLSTSTLTRPTRK